MGWLAEAIGTGSCVSDVKWGECQLGQMTTKQATGTTCFKVTGVGVLDSYCNLFYFFTIITNRTYGVLHASNTFTYVKPIYYVSIPCAYKLPFTVFIEVTVRDLDFAIRSHLKGTKYC